MRRFSVACTALAWVVSTSALAGCDQHGHEHEGEHSKPAPKEAAHQHATAISLNDGARWQVDEHTRQTMATIIAKESQAKPTSAVELQRLGAELDSLNEELIKGCTMKGAAHDNLHHFLTVFMPAIAELKKSTDEATGQAARAKVASALTMYSKHFE